MAGRRNYRRTTAACNGGTQEQAVAEQEVEQTMRMCRHVHPLPTDAGCRSVERQLCELQQKIDCQNRLLMELIQLLRTNSN